MAVAKPIPYSQDELIEMFEYLDGLLFWKVRPSRCTLIGDVAGHYNSNKYIVVTINSVKYCAHRLIYKMFHNSEPNEIDHINQVKCDNEISNLRPTNSVLNQRNRGLMNTNSSGVTGVAFNKRDNAWRSYINYRKKQRHLGTYSTLLDAAAARKSAELAIWRNMEDTEAAR